MVLALESLTDDTVLRREAIDEEAASEIGGERE